MLLGRFISVDPIQDLADPQQWNGYSYANNAPIGQSDPTGLDPCLGGGGCHYDNTDPGGPGWGGPNHVQAYPTPGKPASTATHAKKKDSAPKRYWKSLTHSLGGFVKETGGIAKDSLTCGVIGFDLDSCKRQWHRGLQTFNFANDVAGCLLGNMENGCDHLNSDFDCQNGRSAECLGNLSALAIEIAVIHKLGKVGKALDACSFSPETLVVMGNGSVKPIKDVRLGDKVESTDPRDGITTDKVVTAQHNNHDTDLADLTVVDDSGARAIIHTTQNHPFWDVTSHKWTEAGKLRPGDQLRSSTTNHIHVVAVLPLIKPQTMLNLTVADIHTYYVLAGNTPVLVHNACGDPPPNLSPAGAGRSGAFNQAKRDSGIPTSQSPDRTFPNVDRRGNVQLGTIYEFDVPAPGGGTRTIRIRDDAGGHVFPDDPSQNRGPHFNTENGDHYDY